MKWDGLTWHWRKMGSSRTASNTEQTPSMTIPNVQGLGMQACALGTLKRSHSSHPNRDGQGMFSQCWKCGCREHEMPKTINVRHNHFKICAPHKRPGNMVASRSEPKREHEIATTKHVHDNQTQVVHNIDEQATCGFAIGAQASTQANETMQLMYLPSFNRRLYLIGGAHPCGLEQQSSLTTTTK